jgi:hypothetical protein
VQLRQREAERMVAGAGEVGSVGSRGSIRQRHPVTEQLGVKARRLGGT